jgi:hypothetical protein
MLHALIDVFKIVPVPKVEQSHLWVISQK